MNIECWHCGHIAQVVPGGVQCDFCDPPVRTIEITESKYRELLKKLEAADNCAACLKHAKELGYLGEGSTSGWADDCLAAWRLLQESK